MNEHYYKISDEDVQNIDDFYVECACGEMSDNWTSEPDEVDCPWCIQEIEELRAIKEKEFAKENFGKLFACYCSDSEPKVVSIDGFSLGAIRVSDPNGNTLSWCLMKDLREFDSDEFKKASHEYKIKRCLKKIAYHEKELEEMSRLC